MHIEDMLAPWGTVKINAGIVAKERVRDFVIILSISPIIILDSNNKCNSFLRE